MNGISNKSSNRTSQNDSVKPVKTVETAGSLAMNTAFDYFSVESYDSFSTNNPFAVNYANYADCGGETIASNGFLSGFSGAVSALGGADCAGAGAVAATCASGASSSSGGGFTSFC